MSAQDDYPYVLNNASRLGALGAHHIETMCAEIDSLRADLAAARAGVNRERHEAFIAGWDSKTMHPDVPMMVQADDYVEACALAVSVVPPEPAPPTDRRRFITVTNEGARRLVSEVWALVDRHVIGSRSPAADAALDLRDEIDKDWMLTRAEPAPPTDPVTYRKVPHEDGGATQLWFIVRDEGWRESILCERMYERDADWLLGVLTGRSAEVTALVPAERMALTVAVAMVDRGEGLPPNIGYVVTQALARAAGRSAEVTP